MSISKHVLIRSPFIFAGGTGTMMRQRHRQIFFDAADHFTCWIGVREPNPLADRWIGRAGYTPKPKECKAKTANNTQHPFAGLVVDPNLCPEAFTPHAKQKAAESWKRRFLKGGAVPVPFRVVTHGQENGLVKLRGCAIYADYDLMGLVPSNERGEFLSLPEIKDQVKMDQNLFFEKVQAYINRKLGIPMIQHGPELLYDLDVGAAASEFVLWFGPGRRLGRWPSSMPKPSTKPAKQTAH